MSMTTEVSSSPLVGSDIEALVNHGIEIDAKLAGIDPWRTPSRLCNRRARNEGVRPKRPKLSHGRPIARDDEGAPRLYFTKDGCGIIAQFALGYPSVHNLSVASVA